MSLQLRPLQEQDREPLRAVFVAARDAAFAEAAPGTHKPSDFDRDTDGESIMVALHDGVPVGFAAVWKADNFLHHLFVHPAFQRRGIGKALLAACDPWFGPGPTLKCRQSNRRALGFYLAQGWQLQGEGAGADGAWFLLARGPAGHPA